jgi:hypothetical protein
MAQALLHGDQIASYLDDVLQGARHAKSDPIGHVFIKRLVRRDYRT